MSRAELYLNDRLIESLSGDSVHVLVAKLCELAEREGRVAETVHEDCSVLSVYVTHTDIRFDSGFALEVEQLARLATAGVPLNVVLVDD